MVPLTRFNKLLQKIHMRLGCMTAQRYHFPSKPPSLTTSAEDLTNNHPLVLPGTKPRVPYHPLPLGHKTWPLPCLQRSFLPHTRQSPRHRNVASSKPSRHPTILVPLPLLLVALPQPNPHEPCVRSRRPQRKAVLSLERSAGCRAG